MVVHLVSRLEGTEARQRSAVRRCACPVQDGAESSMAIPVSEVVAAAVLTTTVPRQRCELSQATVRTAQGNDANSSQGGC